MSAVDFASLLCSRLCHDLVGPVGAIFNGVELLADEQDPDMRARCVELLADSARLTANKLKFFRLAFGAAGGFGEQVDAREAHAAVLGLFGPERRIDVAWMIGATALPKQAVKLLLNLAMLAGDSLLRGGKLSIAAEGEQILQIAVRAEGPRLLLDNELRAALSGDSRVGQLTPRAAVAYLVSALLMEAGGHLRISDPDDALLVFGASLPLRL